MPAAPVPSRPFSTRDTPTKRSAMRCLPASVVLVLLPVGAFAAGPAPDVKGVIDRGLTFLAKDNLDWKVKR